MSPHYLPVTPIGSVLPLDEAISLAIYNEPSADTEVYIGPDGELAMVPPPCYGDDPVAAFERYRRDGVTIRRALAAAKIKAIVQSDQGGGFFHVHRFYWLRHDPLLSQTLDDADAPEGLNGQPLIVDEARLDDWRAVVGNVLEPPKLESSRGRKAGVGGFRRNDEAMAPRIHAMIEAGAATSAWDATRQLIDEIPGPGSEENRRKRVARVYNEIYPPHSA